MASRVRLAGLSSSYGANSTDESGESDANSTDCVICLEHLQTNLAALPCGHVFHLCCVEKALANRRVCPICRRQSRNVIRLYFSVGGEESANDSRKGNYSLANRNANHEPIALRIPERLRELQSELDRAHQIQQMTSSHSFRLQNNLVRRQQQLELTTRKMQQIQCELDRAIAEAKKWQRIATSSYEQSNAARQEKANLERKVRAAADQMLQKIRTRQQTRCLSCSKQWNEMKKIAQEFASIVDPCCQRHSRWSSARNLDRSTSSFASVRTPRHLQTATQQDQHGYVL